MRLNFEKIVMKKNAPIPVKDSGFTLLELLLVIIIMTGITMAVAYSAQRALDKINYEKSRTIVNNMSKAIDLYAQSVNRYPCPARTDLAKTDPEYGKEDCTWSGTSASYPSGRDIATYPTIPVRITDPAENNVLIGNLPSRVQDISGNWVSLGQYVPEIDREGSNLLLDPTGNPLIYAVAKKLTDRGSSGQDQNALLGDYGNIKLVDEIGAQLSGVNNDARYILVAQTYRNGGCVDGRRDFENCGDNDDTFVVAPRALNSSHASYYDDVVLFNNKIADQKWLSDKEITYANIISPGNTENRGLVYLNQNGNNIGVGTTNPTEKLDVSGTIRAETNIRAPLICDKVMPIPFTGTTDTVYTYPHRYLNVSDFVVSITSSADVVTVLTQGPDYTVGAFVEGVGSTITLTTEPLTTDTVTISNDGLCVDPLSISSSYYPHLNTAGLTRAPALSCIKGGFSTTTLAENPADWWNGTPAGSFIGTSSDRTLLWKVGQTYTFNGNTYYQIIFRNPDPHLIYDNQYLNINGGPNYLGRTIFLSPDPNNPTRGTPLANQNTGEFRIITNQCNIFKEDGDPSTVCIDQNCDWNTDPSRENCTATPMMTFIIEPVSGTAMIPQTAGPSTSTNPAEFGISFQITNKDRYLAGTKIDNNGVMQPICKDLIISPIVVRDGTNTCPSNQKLRGIQTDGQAVCAND